MSPVHFELMESAFKASGYNIEVLPNDNKQAVDVGLKYVNNDACYPSLMVVGQIMEAILSGKYDLNTRLLSSSARPVVAAVHPIISDLSAVPLKKPVRIYSGYFHQLKRTGRKSWI